MLSQKKRFPWKRTCDVCCRTWRQPIDRKDENISAIMRLSIPDPEKMKAWEALPETGFRSGLNWSEAYDLRQR